MTDPKDRLINKLVHHPPSGNILDHVCQGLTALRSHIDKLNAPRGSKVDQAYRDLTELQSYVDKLKGSPNYKNILAFTAAILGITLLSGKMAIRYRKKGSSKPPRLAGTLICLFVPREKAMVLLGDMIEDYKELRAEHWPIVAKAMYWRQALSTIWPTLKGPIMRLVKIAGIVEIVRRYFDSW